MEDSNNTVVIIADVNPVWWARHNASHDTTKSFESFMQSLLLFCNSYLMINHNNKLAFIACHTEECTFLYPKENSDAGEIFEGDENTIRDGKFEVFVEMNEQITKKLQEIVQTNNQDENAHIVPATLLPGALTKALCYLHSEEKKVLNMKNNKARILILKGSADVSTQYMSVMNCIFAAQKKNILIDSCALLNPSGFLQQASDITGGIYFNVEDISGLLQYMLWMFLPDVNLREKLELPISLQIDYRAACFCHRQLVDVGFVCSICLSIYCQFMPKCLTCQTKFKLPSLMSKPKKKKKEDARKPTE